MTPRSVLYQGLAMFGVLVLIIFGIVAQSEAPGVVDFVWKLLVLLLLLDINRKLGTGREKD